ncbi:hypothetical protein [Luteibacter yeojuensis]|uniref:Uncharacterized protein n=1 Tax=Luteibacter yeojuensis TaxID=345309 RepID=A0A0F3L4H3_9GAMM|nr:hypothetical protein [Luteibacter yeojuensis]KJV37259.1 hypothetical protein VI08_00075 [Luteibacter yeojuensis]
MGLSLAVLVALVFMLPGAAFVFTHQRDVIHARQSGLDSHVSITLAMAITVALLANACWYGLWSLLCDRFGAPRPNAEAFLSLVGGGSAAASMEAIRSVAEHPVRIAAYFCSLTAVGAAFGSFFRSIAALLRGGRDNALWGKLLSPSGVSLVGLTLDVELDGASVLFTGMLRDYAVDRAGELERVVLENAMRKPLRTAAGSGDAAWRAIPGEFVVIRMLSTRTIRVDYPLPRP